MSCTKVEIDQGCCDQYNDKKVKVSHLRFALHLFSQPEDRKSSRKSLCADSAVCFYCFICSQSIRSWVRRDDPGQLPGGGGRDAASARELIKQTLSSATILLYSHRKTKQLVCSCVGCTAKRSYLFSFLFRNMFVCNLTCVCRRSTRYVMLS